ncbi:hypothetical protein [Luteibacter sp.]|jgi:hypothetical protein|uniref:hypothetical protein n=1 Tax=Luteibacter sp. TaxID=1886636 RepID=UPI002F403F3B
MRKLLVFVFCLLSQAAWAGKIELQSGAGNIPAILEREAQYHLDAFLMFIADHPDIVSDVSYMDNIRARAIGMTVARFEYTYEINGRSFTKVYHARSGRSVGGTVADARYGSGGTSDSGTMNEDILREAQETEYYPRDTPFNVRARNLTPVPGSGIVAQGPRSDAELKAVRAIQTNIEDGIIPRGGTLTAYVSKTPCQSCTNAIRNFAEEYNVDGTVHFMIEGKGTVEGPGKVKRSMRANQTFFTKQKDRVKAQFRNGNVRKPTSIAWGEDSERLLATQRELELTGATSTAEACE